MLSDWVIFSVVVLIEEIIEFVFSSQHTTRWVHPSSLTLTSVPWRSRMIFFSTTAADGSFLVIGCNLVSALKPECGSLKTFFKTVKLSVWLDRNRRDLLIQLFGRGGGWWESGWLTVAAHPLPFTVLTVLRQLCRRKSSVRMWAGEGGYEKYYDKAKLLIKGRFNLKWVG